MKRLWKISEFHKCLIVARFSLYSNDRVTKPSVPVRFICQNVTQMPYTDENQTKVTDLASLVSDKWSYNYAETVAQAELRQKVSKLKEILSQYKDVGKIDKVLEQNGVALFRRYSSGSAVVELLTQLSFSPTLAMEVLEWRRKQLDYAAPMTVEEYSKGITIASRLNSVDLAVELFKEASDKQLKSTSLFNALMTAYSSARLPMKCQSLFLDLKMDPTCAPSIVTYNILIAAYGRMMLIDHMEATLREMRDLDLAPDINTYRGLLVGYITAWMWDKMEETYWAMKAGPVKPNLDIYLLMVRGYALAGKLERMEAIYGMVRDHVYRNIPLIRVMIRAYCKSSDAARVQKVEQLLQKIPENDYRPWLNVILIGLYANEDLLDKMENSINEAFDHNIYVTSVGVMKQIISSYFRLNEVDKLADFVQRAQSGGWRTCRSLYHCKMVMYDSEMRLSEMESCLDEMYRLNMHLSKKTYWILFKSYSKWGQKSKLEQILGRMWKNGYEVQFGTCNSKEYFC